MTIKDKFKNVSAFSFQTDSHELMICFNGFEEEEDIKEFANFLFGKIKMNYNDMLDQFPTVH